MANYRTKIGIPRALLYYKYGDLWANFFHELGCEIVYSPKSNFEILEQGKRLSIDESCLSLKLYLGHVAYLSDKVDYLLVPRIVSLAKREKMCTNFNALYDIVNNLFDARILHYNIDVEKRVYEKQGFMLMGKKLYKSRSDIIRAYKKAKRIVKRKERHRYIKQSNLLIASLKKKILLVGHSYNLNDDLIGQKVIDSLIKEDIDIIYADIFDKDEIKDKYQAISKQLYWTYSKELLSSIVYYQDKVDGIILLSVFPCGPDSLTNEMCIRKVKKPIMMIIIDELTNDIGLETRIECFIDIIKRKEEPLYD